MGEKCPSRKIPGPKRGILQEEITVSKNVCVMNTPENFYGGKISKFAENWTKLSTDP
jgi:hypothetical protein